LLFCDTIIIAIGMDRICLYGKIIGDTICYSGISHLHGLCIKSSREDLSSPYSPRGMRAATLLISLRTPAHKKQNSKSSGKWFAVLLYF